MRTDVKNITNDDEFFADTADTQKEEVEQHRKQECLKDTISKVQRHLLCGKKNNGHMKNLINLVTKPMLNTGNIR